MWIRFARAVDVGICLGVRAGLRDAAAHRRAYLAAFVTTASARRALLRDMWKDVARLCVARVHRGRRVSARGPAVVSIRCRPVVVMGLLAIAPYLLVRGPVTRFARASPPDTSRERFSSAFCCWANLAPALADVPKYGVKVKVNKHFDFRS
jgi:hypothetical protein